MKRSSFFAYAIWLVVFFFLAGMSAGAERGIQVKRIDDFSHESGKLGEYRALIIGINDYKGSRIPDLETPINDATAIAKVLKEKYGFKIQLLLDREATREAIYKGLRSLAASSKPNDSVLIYFAGHGDLDRTYDDGWWIPADAEGGNPATYLDNVQVQKAMRSMKARHVLLISDSCYSGTLFGKARSLPPVIDDKYYLSLYNEKSRWGMTSGNKTPVSDQGTAGHSVFAYQLIKELERNDKPFLSTQEIYTRIAPVIANNSEQTPLCRPIVNTGDQGGEFVFVASVKKDPPPINPGVQQSAIDKEMLFWQSIQNSDDPALFEAYLNKFPNGFFAPIAKRKIEAFKQEKDIASIPPEIQKSRLYVEVEPTNARVRILNIGPKFQQGMELDPGRYHVEVSSDGYGTKEMWVKLEKGETETLRLSLEQKSMPQVKTSIQQTSKYSKPLARSSLQKNLSEIRDEAMALYKKRQYAEAVKPFNEALQIDPNDSWTLKYLADSLQATKQYKQALIHIEKAIELNPKDEFSYQVKAHILYKEVRHAEAIKAFNEALKIDPNDSWTLKYLADSLQARKQYKQALIHINKAIELNPKDTFSYKVKGNIFYKEGRNTEAIKAFHEALNISPNDSWTLKYLADSLQATKQYKQALIHIDKAIELNPKDTFSYKVKGNILYKEGRNTEAIKAFHEALNISPNDSWTIERIQEAKSKKR